MIANILIVPSRIEYKPMNYKSFMNSSLILGVVLFSGCNTSQSPSSPDDKDPNSISGQWITDLGPANGINSGEWEWKWLNQDGITGNVMLEQSPIGPPSEGWNIQWIFPEEGPMPIPDETIDMIPIDRTLWHQFRWSSNNEENNHSPLTEPTFPFPIPRIPVQSPHYGCLLELLNDLTIPYFNQVVTHWPSFPVPVRIGEAVNGPVDLAACLTEAMAIWNDGASSPWFVASQNENWGIRLIHFPDREMVPSMGAKITRLDSLSRPMRVQIITGNNYHTALSRPYAVRGFVHELGHALFLWGHSDDMAHSLWRRGPPLVSQPSEDERKAALLWHGLPEGLDLSNYQID